MSSHEAVWSALHLLIEDHLANVSRPRHTIDGRLQRIEATDGTQSLPVAGEWPAPTRDESVGTGADHPGAARSTSRGTLAR